MLVDINSFFLSPFKEVWKYLDNNATEDNASPSLEGKPSFARNHLKFDGLFSTINGKRLPWPSRWWGIIHECGDGHCRCLTP